MTASPSDKQPSAGKGPTPSATEETISLSAEKRIDQVCLAFEDAWKAGREPRLEDCLGTTQKPERSALLRELLLIELDYRRRLGQQPTPEEYQTRLPDDSEAILSAFGRAVPPAEQTPLGPGTKLGRYRVERVLGSGASADVYLARDDELDRPVAIKVLARGWFDSEAAVDRFLEEARTVARLEHPAIVPVHDFGRSDQCRPFIVMRYVEGQSLRDRLRAARLSHAEAAEMILHVAEALNYAHQRGVVHRDLKPGNILLDTLGRPHVADFGLAIHETAERHHAGEFSGTLPYMAPEQVRRETHRLDGRTDIWAMGVIVYELLTGRRPFNGQTEEEIGDEIKHREPKPPRQIDDTIPVELERICLHCLAKPVTDRYATAGDVAHDLRRWLRPASPLRRWLAAGLAGVLILAGVLAGWHLTRKVAPPRPLHSRIDVLIWSDTEPTRRGLGLRDPTALPLRPGDQIRVGAELDRPMYVYLLWIDYRGQIMPVYPWSLGRWDLNTSADKPQLHLSLPEPADQGWPMEGGPGMETLMLLARETPLPRDLDLPGLLAATKLPPQGLQNERALAEFEQGRVVAAAEYRDRGPKLFDPTRINDPVLQTQKILAEKLGPHFSVLHAVSFANAGPAETGGKK